MNILYIAYSCAPYSGSEDKIGWNVPLECAKNNVVYVITKMEHRHIIQRYQKEVHMPNIKFYFVDIPPIYKRIFKGVLYSGRLNIWNKRALRTAKTVCHEHQIDIIHQITPVEFRSIGNYGTIKNTKFLCGPLGGGEHMPVELRTYAKGHMFIEVIRSVLNHWHRFKLNIFNKMKKCDYIMFANEETRDYLCVDKNLRMQKPVTEIGIESNQIENCMEDKVNECCDFLVAGRLVYRKGHDLLLDALLRIPKEFEYRCYIVGDGPERKKIQNRCNSNEILAKRVIFTGAVPYEKMEKIYAKANVLIMPSIRETTGTVLLEAMAKGLPIITIEKYGGKVLLDKNTGWFINGISKESYIENLKNAIIECILNPDDVIRRGVNARKKAEQYTWKSKIRYYENIYYKLLEEDSL